MSTPMKSYQSSLFSYMQILDNDKEKINFKENLLHNKLKVFEKIENITESFFNYIKLHSCELTEKRSDISDKLILIKEQIDEYMKIFYENKKDINTFDDCYKANTKIGNSIDFLIAQKAKPDKTGFNDSYHNFSNTMYDRRDYYSSGNMTGYILILKLGLFQVNILRIKIIRIRLIISFSCLIRIFIVLNKASFNIFVITQNLLFKLYIE
jgi:hypothetical protein